MTTKRTEQDDEKMAVVNRMVDTADEAIGSDQKARLKDLLIEQQMHSRSRKRIWAAQS